MAPHRPISNARSRLTPNQIRGFWAAWGGWALDGMDSFIYALVLVPALTELLPRSGIAGDARQRRLLRQRAVRAVPGRLGPVDAVGTDRRSVRPRPHADADDPLLLAVHVSRRGRDQRLAARGVPACSPASASAASGRWAAPSSPKSGRKIAARSAPATCTPATTSDSFWRRSPTTSIGASYGWRWMFAVGGTPALLVTFIRYGVRESARWRTEARASGSASDDGRRSRSSSRRRYRATDVAELALSARVDRRVVGGIGLRADLGDASRAAKAGIADADAARARVVWRR